MSEQDLEKLSEIIEEKHYSAGEVVFYEGEIGDSFYIVESGLVEIITSLKTQEEQIVATISPNGEVFFGEIALLDNQPRTATARTLMDSKLLKIEKDQFDILGIENPHWYQAIASTLSSRVRESHVREIRTLQKTNRELEKAYQQLKEAQEELIKKEKMAAIGNVASRIVHDIKNLLTSIRGFAEIIRMKSPENKRFSDAIVQQVQLMVEMIQEVLYFAKGEESVLDIQSYKVGPFLKDLLEVFELSLERDNIAIVTNFQYPGTAWFDEVALRRILHNLINNAKDAMKKMDNGVITISTCWDGDYWMTKVEDNARGIPQEILDTVFEPFVTKGKSHGTGLGLAICKKLVEAHKGTITVESIEGKGTIFTIRLPINPEKI